MAINITAANSVFITSSVGGHADASDRLKPLYKYCYNLLGDEFLYLHQYYNKPGIKCHLTPWKIKACFMQGEGVEFKTHAFDNVPSIGTFWFQMGMGTSQMYEVWNDRIGSKNANESNMTKRKGHVAVFFTFRKLRKICIIIIIACVLYLTSLV